MKRRWSILGGVRTAVVLGAVLAGASAQSAGKSKIPEIVSTVDTSGGTPTADQLQELNEISKKAAETGRSYYRKIIELVGAQRHPVPDKVTISFNYSYKGVAATGDNHTEVSIPYALAHPDDIPGVIVHEFTHVVQAYTKDTGYDTGWLTEGIADYVRWFNYEPVSKRPHPHRGPRTKATAAYQTTAAFLFWAVNKYDKNLVKQMNEALYDGTYKPDLWVKFTGKSLDDLNTEWVATLEP